MLDIPTFTNLAVPFLEFSKLPPSNSHFKTLTVANKAEVPLLFKVTLTLIHFPTRKHTNVKYNVAVANIGDKIFRIFFFEQNVKTLDQPKFIRITEI